MTLVCSDSVGHSDDRRADAERRAVPEEVFWEAAVPALRVRDVEPRAPQDPLHPPRAAALEVQVLRDQGPTVVSMLSACDNSAPVASCARGSDSVSKSMYFGRSCGSDK